MPKTEAKNSLAGSTEKKQKPVPPGTLDVPRPSRTKIFEPPTEAEKQEAIATGVAAPWQNGWRAAPLEKHPHSRGLERAARLSRREGHHSSGG